MGVKLMQTTVLITVLFTIASGRVYSLNDVLSEAMKNATSIKVIEEEMHKSESETQVVYGTALPAIGASVNFNHNFVVNEVDVSAPQDNPIIDTLQNVIARLMTSKKSSGVFSVSASQPLFAQGKVYLGLKLANKYLVTLNCKLQEEKLRIRGMMVKLYFSGLMAQKNVQISYESVGIANETHRIMRLKESLGTASELDTLSSRLHLKNAEIALSSAESELRVSYENIMNAAGIYEQVSYFSLQDSIPVRDFALSLDETIELVKRDNLSLTQLSGHREIQNMKVKMAKTDFLPSIYCGASLGKIGQCDGAEDLGNIVWSDERKVFIGANWDIFTGMIRNQKLYQAKVDRRIFELNEKQVLDNTVLATRNAYEKVITSKNQLVVALEVVSLAERGLQLAKLSLEAGSKIYLDMQNAELELHKAKIIENNATYAYFSAVIDLQILTGTLQF